MTFVEVSLLFALGCANVIAFWIFIAMVMRNG